MTDAPFSLPPDYTLPTLEQRLDAAAEAWRLHLWRYVDDKWEDLEPGRKERYLIDAEVVCRAFAPEHFKAETGDVA